jgi:hypothetical protein
VKTPIEKLAAEMEELRLLRRTTMAVTIMALAENPGDPLVAEAYVQASREYEALVKGEPSEEGTLPCADTRRLRQPSPSASASTTHLRLVQP